jgi:hypothetical protein
MTDADQPTSRLRWARSQRFRLTAKGLEAERDWKERLAGAQGAGRSGFDTAVAEWAKSFGVKPDDTAVMSELAVETRRLEDVLAALADTGVSREQVKQVLERLHGAGLLEPVTAPS